MQGGIKSLEAYDGDCTLEINMDWVIREVKRRDCDGYVQCIISERWASMS